MKKIEAIIKPFKLDEVKDALEEAGIEGMTVSEVREFGRQEAHAEVFRGTEHKVDCLPEIKIELIVEDHSLNAAVAAITKGSQTSAKNGGRVFVSTIEDALHIHA